MGPKVSVPKVGHAVGNLEFILQRVNQKTSSFLKIVYELNILDMVEGVTKT